MNFEEIDIDRTEIAQSKLNIENKTLVVIFIIFAKLCEFKTLITKTYNTKSDG